MSPPGPKKKAGGRGFLVAISIAACMSILSCIMVPRLIVMIFSHEREIEKLEARVKELEKKLTKQ
jgi:hypothetical protein